MNPKRSASARLIIKRRRQCSRQIIRSQQLGNLEMVELQTQQAFALCACGRYQEGLWVYKMTYWTSRQRLGRKHVKTLDAMSNLADCYCMQGMNSCGGLNPLRVSVDFVIYALNNSSYPRKAAELYGSCYKARAEILGENHDSTLDALQGLASVCAMRKQHAIAQKILEGCLERRRAHFGSSHEKTQKTHSQLGKLYQEMNVFS